MSSTVLPSPTATRNPDERITAALITRITDNDIGVFDSVDEMLLTATEPHLGDGYGRPVDQRRAGR